MMDKKQQNSVTAPTSSEAVPPPSYDDSLQTPWQGTSSGDAIRPVSSARPPLDSEQYPLYTTSIPENAEQLTYAERLVIGVETETVSHGDVVTHSELLHDPAALEAFIKQQASIPPTLKISCRGSHLRQKHPEDLSRSDNDLEQSKRSHNEMVVDFDFQIDLTSILESTVDLRTLTTVRPDRAVCRGTYRYTFHPAYKPYGPHYRPHPLRDAIDRWSGGTRSFDLADAKTLATKPGIRPVRQERNLLEKWNRERRGKGLPYWAPRPESLVQAIEAVRDQVRQRSDAKYQKATRCQARSQGAGSADYSRIDQLEEGHLDEADPEHATLLEWCQEFCRSSLPLKEFRLYKSIYGWEFDSLHVAIRAAIASTGYQGDIRVTYIPGRSLTTVVPNNFMARWLTRTWVNVLLWITLLYPFLWLYKRLIAGGCWSVATAQYPLKCYVPYDPTTASFTSDSTNAYEREIRLGPTYQDAKGNDSQLYELKGYKEGRFMKRWEGRIKDAVIRRVGSHGRSEVLGDALLAEREDAAGRQVIRGLDGYESA